MAEAVETYRRRRRRTRERLPSPLRHPAVGKGLAIAVALCAAFDVAWTVSALHGASTGYGLVGPGMSEDDVRYAMGQPASRLSTSASRSAWLYRQSGSAIRVEFDSAKMFVRAECSNSRSTSGDCPDVLGLRLGSSEEQIWYALGTPDRQSYDGDTKLMDYRSLGLTFSLRQLQIVGIALQRPAGSFSYLERLPRVLVP